MDSLSAFAMGRAATAAGAKHRVFDWDKAARLLLEHKPDRAAAGLSSDLEWTAGIIWRKGDPIRDEYTYLASNWAEPVLVIDGTEHSCWCYKDDSPGWGADTKWPESALNIIADGRR